MPQKAAQIIFADSVFFRRKNKKGG